MKIMLVMLLMLVGINAEAAGQKKCPPKCSHRAVQHASCLGDAILSGFEITGGFRWDYREGCPDRLGRTHTVSHDPPFIGAQIRVPVTQSLGVFVSGDRDFVEAPQGNIRLGVFLRPFGR